MRRPEFASLSLLLPFALAASISPSIAEVTRTLRVSLPPSATTSFAVENLAGTMRILPGSGDRVTAVATVHAGSEELAGGVRFEEVKSAEGTPILRVRYPLDQHRTIRYGNAEKESGILGLLGGGVTSLEYDGRRVKVSTRDGAALHAAVEVRLPAGKVVASFRNSVGLLSAETIQGTLRFETASGDILIDRIEGETTADSGSGNVKATRLEGSFRCDTGSGDCTLDGFRGDQVEGDVGSGEIVVKSAIARRIVADTGSGDIRILDSDVEELSADTGSGDVVFEAKSGRLTKVAADTGSGDVTLRLPPEATFEAHADQGSGDITVGYQDAEPIYRHREVVGYRRGDSRIRIDVSTGSGELTIQPLR